MLKHFIKLNNSRIRISTIKRYSPSGDNQIIVRFSASLKDYQSEVFTFDTKDVRDSHLTKLDSICI